MSLCWAVLQYFLQFFVSFRWKGYVSDGVRCLLFFVLPDSLAHKTFVVFFSRWLNSSVWTSLFQVTFLPSSCIPLSRPPPVGRFVDLVLVWLSWRTSAPFLNCKFYRPFQYSIWGFSTAVLWSTLPPIRHNVAPVSIIHTPLSELIHLVAPSLLRARPQSMGRVGRITSALASAWCYHRSIPRPVIPY